jgi:phage FluMu protein Com
LSYAFRCPTCNTAIADVPGPGVVDATCSRCRYAYRITTGPVEVAATREAALVRHGTAQPGQFEREHDLRIRPTPHAVEVASFRRPLNESPVSLGPGDLVTLAHTLRGSEPAQLAVVVNHTARQTHVLRRPGGEWTAYATHIVLAVVLAGITLTALTGSAVALVFSIFAAIILSGIARAQTSQRRRLHPTEIGELQRTETLLEQKQKLAARHRELSAEHTRKEALARRLRALREKMEAVGEEHYATRMRIVDTGLRVLEQQLETGRRLLAQYDRTERLLEIEIESGTLLAGVADTDAGEIQHAMDELAALRAAHEALQRRLAADEEVERLLRP